MSPGTRQEALGYALAGALIALLIAATIPKVSAFVGQPLILGERNISGTSQTKIWAVANNSALKITNKLSGHPALWLEVADELTPPMRVSSPARVDNLNADMVDGQDATGFVQGNGFFTTLDEGQTTALANQGDLWLEMRCAEDGTSLYWVTTNVGFWYTGTMTRNGGVDSEILIVTTTQPIEAVSSTSAGFSVASTSARNAMVIDLDSTVVGHDNVNYGYTCFAIGSITRASN